MGPLYTLRLYNARHSENAEMLFNNLTLDEAYDLADVHLRPEGDFTDALISLG